MRFLCILALILFNSGMAVAQPYTLINASIVDVERGEVRGGHTIIIENDEIVQITHGAPAQKNTKVIDLQGRFVMPGLWDMHIHPDSKKDLALFVANGVTGARIMYGFPEHLSWRAEVALNRVVGPQLLIAGPIIEGPPPGSYDDITQTSDKTLVHNQAEAAQVASQQHAAGFDYLKVYNHLSKDAYRSLAVKSTQLNMPIVGHVPLEVGLEGALEHRQASIEHLRGYVQELTPEDAPAKPGADLRSRSLAWQYADSSRFEKVVADTLEAGTYICPTLTFRIFFATQEEIDAFVAGPYAPFTSPESRDILKNRHSLPWLSNFSDDDLKSTQLGFEKQDALIAELAAANVPILAGTDSPDIGVGLHRELAHLVGAGLTPAQALKAATITPALWRGAENHGGRVEENYEADLVILNENPLDDIANTTTIHAVILGGAYLDRDRLDELIAENEYAAD